MKRVPYPACRLLGALALTLLFSTTFCGCCLEYKEKPGLVLRGEVELNRTKAIERTREIFMQEDEDEYLPHHHRHKKRLKKRKHSKEHTSPCGRFGCLRCALGPSSVDEMLEQDLENEEIDENENPMMPDPKQFGKLYGQSAHHPGMMGYGMWMPGMVAPQGGIALAPVPVINPNNGQQMIVQPAMPGQPGVMMLHAFNGQPIMVNPYVQPMAAPSGGLLAGTPAKSGAQNKAENGEKAANDALTPPAPPTPGGAAQNNAAQNNAAQSMVNPYANFRPIQGVPNPYAMSSYGMPPYGMMPPQFAQNPWAMPPGMQPGMMQPGMSPYGMQPHMMSHYGTPMFAPMGIAAIDPRTGMIVPNPCAQNPYGQNPYGQNPYAISANAVAQAQQESDEETPSGLRTQMPTPKFHPVPSKPVFQRTEGLATNKEAAEEIRLKNLRLEKALGMKVPDGARIADNGINQRIIQVSAEERRNGGGPLVGAPFQSISGILGLNSDESKPVKTAQVRSQKTQETTKNEKNSKKVQNNWLGISSSSSQAPLQARNQPVHGQPTQGQPAQVPQRGVNAELNAKYGLPEGAIILDDRETLSSNSIHATENAEYGSVSEYGEYDEESVPQNSSVPHRQSEDRLWEELFENTKGPGIAVKHPVRQHPGRQATPQHRHAPRQPVAKKQGDPNSFTGKITSFFTPQKPEPNAKVCRPCPPQNRRPAVARSTPQHRHRIVQNHVREHREFETDTVELQTSEPASTFAKNVITTDNVEVDAYEDFDEYEEYESENQLAQETFESDADAELPLLLSQKKRNSEPASPNRPAVFKKKESSNEIVQIRFQDEP